jgi:hypothetical protein
LVTVGFSANSKTSSRSWRPVTGLVSTAGTAAAGPLPVSRGSESRKPKAESPAAPATTTARIAFIAIPPLAATPTAAPAEPAPEPTAVT